MNTYTLHYTVHYKDGSYSQRTTRVKNCYSELHAKVKLEKWLERKERNFHRITFDGGMNHLINTFFK